MIANYGYKDGSGEFFITMDTDKCDGCKKCEEACPHGVLITGEDENDPFREEPVAKVAMEHRKKIKYSCAPCKPSTGERALPCVNACETSVISHSW